MTSNLGTEKTTVQTPFVKHATAIGWSYLSDKEALSRRRGSSGVFLYTVLREKLIELNPGFVTEENVESIIQRMESARSGIEGNAEILSWVRGERSVYVETETRSRNVTVISFDKDKIDQNRFHVTDEWEYTNGRKGNRADVVFLVNGIPLVVVEAKSSKKSLDDGIEQIRRYHRETPEMMTAPQVFDATNLLDFYYGVTWSLERKNLFNWKDDEPGNFERKVKRFFSRERFLRMMRDWIIFFKKDDELRKAILRQHQTRAVELVVNRVLDLDKTRGLVWHTQGSGKTFTMIKAAELILRHPLLERPTVIMLVDRNELESQLFANLAAYGLSATVAESKRHLRELLASDHRGIIVSMIHKFEKADADLCPRENVVILVDEAHRTTGGDLGIYLVAAIPKATIIGFTGTPIDKTVYGQGTFKVFGKDDHPRGYLDKYSIADSIQDGTTLELHYTVAPNEIRVPRDVLEKEFLSLKEAEGVSDIEELNKILEKAVTLRAFLKAKDRVDQVAQFVARHFKDYVDPLGYKAFLVAVDREACALYKQALDKYFPPEWSRVVYSSLQNDSELMSKYRISSDEEKKLRKAFVKRESLPKVLIVTEKLLTGFDAPILYAMYLDKPMRDHALLQAIARVNRPYEDDQGIKKPCGFVLDFVGLFERLQDALSFDSDEVNSVIKNIDVLKFRFETLMNEQAPNYLRLCSGEMDDKAVERAIEAFAEKPAREAFYKFFKEDLEPLYEIISPDAFLRPWLEKYTQLTTLFRIVRHAYSKRTMLIKDLMRKTEALVQSHATSSGPSDPLPIVKINEQTLRALKEDASNQSAKVINLGRGLIQSVIEESQSAPHLIPIGDRAEAILDRFDDRQESTQEALQALQKLAEEYLEAKREADQVGLDPNTFTIFRILKQNEIGTAKEVAPTIEAAIQKRPHFKDNPAELRLLKADLYKVLLPVVGKSKMVAVAEEILRLPRS